LNKFTQAKKRRIPPLAFSFFLQNFMASKHPVNYFIRLYNFRDVTNLQSFCLDNSQTNERLVIKEEEEDNVDEYEYPQTYFLISRHPIGASEKWIKEMDIGTDNEDYEYCNIDISI
jgi:hypothetical protein